MPARGATPAITARFDVNYILGQKLSDNRQQTVVVDYYSSVKEQELEYTVWIMNRQALTLSVRNNSKWQFTTIPHCDKIIRSV